MIKRVMTFTPYGPRLEPETVSAVLALEWPGPVTHVFQRDNPHGDARLDILHQYQQGREVFLAGDFDAILIVESDIIPPPDALIRLAALDVDMAYGVYRFRTTNVVNVFERYPGSPRNEGESLSIHPAKLAAAVQAGITLCSGGGLGCVLIKRHVLERLSFRLEATAFCDTYFNRDVMQAGLVQAADMGVVCGHKDEHGVILWPWLGRDHA